MLTHAQWIQAYHKWWGNGKIARAIRGEVKLIGIDDEGYIFAIYNDIRINQKCGYCNAHDMACPTCQLFKREICSSSHRKRVPFHYLIREMGKPQDQIDFKLCEKYRKQICDAILIDKKLFKNERG